MINVRTQHGHHARCFYVPATNRIPGKTGGLALGARPIPRLSCKTAEIQQVLAKAIETILSASCRGLKWILFGRRQRGSVGTSNGPSRPAIFAGQVALEISIAGFESAIVQYSADKLASLFYGNSILIDQLLAVCVTAKLHLFAELTGPISRIASVWPRQG